mmetsp:Transcript_35074/g.45218  ORF Transcript_35074/g.45218 Transcript_35074/m.45218 type:complete len:848 (-) Transcript_35074:709-3252(-)
MDNIVGKMNQVAPSEPQTPKKLPPLQSVPNDVKSPSEFETTLKTTLFASKLTSPLKQEMSKFTALADDATQNPHFMKLADRNVDAENNFGDYIAYKIENLIAADANFRFYILLTLTVGSCILFAIIWAAFVTPSEDVQNAGDALFMVFQLLITGGYDNGLEKLDQRITFFFIVAVGVVLISTLIGLISDSVKVHMESLSEGTTKVVEKNHTVILGWNDSTIRVLIQIAHLRHVFKIQNNNWKCFFFPWLKAIPSSPVVSATVVVLNESLDKNAMEDLVLASFQAVGISSKITKIGRDIIFRKGNPSLAHDLVRVGAQNATSILVMMTDEDKNENGDASGLTDNSATLRTVLALRNVILANGNPEETFNPNLRIVVELDSPCPFIDEAFFVTPTGRQVLYPQNLQRNINSILFYCASKPGLSRVLVALYNFEGVAIRCRKVKHLKGGINNEKGWFIGKTINHAHLYNYWYNGIVIGCDDPNLNFFDEEDDEDGTYNGEGCAGIQGDPSRILDAEDTLIFVSETSSPQSKPRNQNVDDDGIIIDYAKEAIPYLEATLKEREVAEMFSGGALRGGHNAALQIVPTKPLRVLLCGWRSEWDKDGASFKERIKDIAAGMAIGSVITCVNIKSRLLFGAHIEQNGFHVSKDISESPNSKLAQSQRQRWELKSDSLSGIYIEHFKADPVKYEEMVPLFSTGEYHTAICLGSVVGKDLSNHARDSRVLSMLLILRKLSKHQRTPLNIIAENYQDQTSGLAVVPLNRSREADFVNTTAIKSRSLVMNLAYPEIQDALSELIVSVPNTPEVGFIETRALGIQGATVKLPPLVTFLPLYDLKRKKIIFFIFHILMYIF